MSLKYDQGYEIAEAEKDRVFLVDWIHSICHNLVGNGEGTASKIEYRELPLYIG